MASPSTHTSYQALVFGASGITGWAIVNNALLYPSPNTFDRIVGLTHRPLSLTDARFPDDRRIELYSGIDLSNRAGVVSQLRKVPQIENITHVFFAAYTGHGTDFQELKRANMEILVNTVEALEKLSPKMAFFTLQTGGKAYGIEFVDKIPLKVPSKETDPRIPEPFASDVFYYTQYDYLAQVSQGKSWRFCEIRPDVIVGFVPQNNAMNLAQALGLFLSLYKSIRGPGAPVPFPGPPPSAEHNVWTTKRCDTSQDILARFHLFSATHPESVSTRAFNVADGTPGVVTWEMVWPGICDYFGLKGVPPDGSLTGAEWMRQHRSEWKLWEEKTGVKKGALEGTTWDFMEGVMGGTTGRSVDRQYDLSAIREVGFTEKVDTVAGYHIAFDRMRKANIIP